MAGTYTRWYREGTVALTYGSPLVTGTNTYWLSAGLNPGDIFSLDGITDYEILSIADNTHITLKANWGGENVSGLAYHIIRNFTAHVPSQIAAQLADLYSDLTRYWDQDTQTIHGKSAYEIAKLHGYTGTEAQWLESLKAAQEWTTLNDRTNILTYNNAAAHNSIYRGKILGSAITGDMIANIRNGSFKNWYPGDFFTLPIDGTTTVYVMGCNSAFCSQQGYKNHVVLLFSNHSWNNLTWNDTDTIEGHLYNSKMFNVHLPYMLGKIKEVIPDEYILKVNEEGVADSVDGSGNVNHYTTVNDLQIFLPSMQNWFGFSSDYTNNGYKVLSNFRWHWSYAQTGFYGIWHHRTCNSRGRQWCCFRPYAGLSKFASYVNPSYTNAHYMTKPYILLG